MRLNLLVNNPGGVRSGYVNVDPIAPEGDRDRVKGPLEDLGHVCDGGEAEEIVAHDVLDLYPSGAADQVLSNWLSKLAHGGRISLSVVDLMEVARAVVSHSLTVEQANELLHGRQERPWEFRRATYMLPVVAEVLARKGLNVISKRVANYRAVIVAQRP